MKKLMFLLTLTIGILLSGCTIDTSNDVDVLTEDELKGLIEELIPNAEVTTSYDLSSFENAITQMTELSRSGVLGIQATSDVRSGTGSGVIYKKEGNTYYMVTNAHVVVHSVVELVGDVAAEVYYETSTQEIIYELNGILFVINDNVNLLGYDITTDLAVLTFESDKDFTVIPMGDSYELELGQFVFAVGNPLGFEYYGTITMGIISGKTRYVDDGDFSATLIQHDAAISPGNSGGALLNLDGELIGINNMKIVDDLVTGIGFAIPSNTVKRIVADLEDDGIITRPYLGISTNALVNNCGTDFGVCINVLDGGAAEAAGLIDDDLIIGYKNTTSVEFLDIYNFNDLKEAILNSSVGESITIKYIRDGEEEISEAVILGIHPDD
jgi:serine protease Do